MTVDNDPYFDPDILIDVLQLCATDLPWSPDIVLASPPCERFSVSRMKHWPNDPPSPDDYFGKIALRLVKRTVHLIRYLRPQFFVIENPVGYLRHTEYVGDPLIPWERRVISQCSYGREQQKKTDLWGGFPPSLELRLACRRGDPCHIPTPRGSHVGIQSWTLGYNDKAEIPHQLSLAVCLAAEKDLELLRAPASREKKRSPKVLRPQLASLGAPRARAGAE